MENVQGSACYSDGKKFISKDHVGHLQDLCIYIAIRPPPYPKKEGKKPAAVCCPGCLNTHLSEMIRNHWVVSGGGNVSLWPIRIESRR